MPPRLLVRVGPDFLRGGDLHRGDGGSAPAVAAARLQAWGVGRVSSEEAGTMSGPIKLIRLDEIGTEEKLPLPEWEWEHSDTTRMAGIGGAGGSGGHQTRKGSGGGGDGGSSTRGERYSHDLGRGDGGGGGHGSAARHVHARVSAEGRTRVLLISSHKDIRRTISTFNAKESSLVRQQWHARLVLDKYMG